MHVFFSTIDFIAHSLKYSINLVALTGGLMLQALAGILSILEQLAPHYPSSTGATATGMLSAIGQAYTSMALVMTQALYLVRPDG